MALKQFGHDETIEEFDRDWIESLYKAWVKLTAEDLKSFLRKRGLTTNGKKPLNC